MHGTWEGPGVSQAESLLVHCVQVMYMCMDATTGWSFLYFIAIVFLGSFFVLQLALGVITDVYEAEEAEMNHLAELEKAEEDRLKREELAKIGKTLEDYNAEQQEEEEAVSHL